MSPPTATPIAGLRKSNEKMPELGEPSMYGYIHAFDCGLMLAMAIQRYQVDVSVPGCARGPTHLEFAAGVGHWEDQQFKHGVARRKGIFSLISWQFVNEDHIFSNLCTPGSCVSVGS